MTFRIDRTRRPVSVRRTAAPGSDTDKETQAASSALLPVAVGPATSAPRPDSTDNEATFAAQLMGQDGQKRGLRGGEPVLDAARRLYSSIEWSGSRDRRARKGRNGRAVA